MKQAQFVVLSAIAILLAVIAFQLTQVERDLRLFRSSGTTSVAWPVREPETREERNKRLQHMTQEAIEDGRAILATPDPPRRASTRPAR